MEHVDAETNPAAQFVSSVYVQNDDDEAASQMAKSLAKIVNSDVEGVMDVLAFDSKSNDGKQFTAFAKQMLEAGAEDSLGEIFAKLKLGNDLKGDAAERLEAKTLNESGNEVYPHGQALGHFIGAVYAASTQITKDQREQAIYATSVIKSAFTILDKLKLGGPMVGGALSVGKDIVSIALYEAMITQNLSAAQKLEKASIPVDPSTKRESVGSLAKGFLSSVIEQIGRLNR